MAARKKEEAKEEVKEEAAVTPEADPQEEKAEVVKMVKVKVKVRYEDLQEKKIMEIGDRLDVTLQRAVVLLDKGFVALVK